MNTGDMDTCKHASLKRLLETTRRYLFSDQEGPSDVADPAKTACSISTIEQHRRNGADKAEPGAVGA